jgi:uncharacterized protein involved in response to NO
MRKGTALTTFLLLALSGMAIACPVCGPGPGQKASDAASNAILFLLAVVLLVIGGIVSFAVTLALRSSRLARENGLTEIVPLNTPPLTRL